MQLTASAVRGAAGRSTRCCERAGIADIADRLVGKCSGGQQQRLRFAMALLSDPELLILDEPTTGMDVEGRRDFWGAIRDDAARGRTVLFATHYLEEADAYADRIVLVRQGQIVADGTAARSRRWPPAAPSGDAARRRRRGAAGHPGRRRASSIRGDRVLVTRTRLRRGGPPPAHQHRRP